MAETAEPTFTLRASDPAAPFALLAYASAARNNGESDAYVADVRAAAVEMYEWQDAHGITPPDKVGVRSSNADRMFRDGGELGWLRDDS